MTPEHHYRVGSTTRTFTAVVALQRVAEGQLGPALDVLEVVIDVLLSSRLGYVFG